MPPAATTSSPVKVSQGKVMKNAEPKAKKRRITRTIQMPPKNLVRTSERMIPPERDMNLAAQLSQYEGPLDLASQEWLKSYSASTPTKPFAVITCASTVTALSAVVDSITTLCNESITPMYTDDKFDPQVNTLDAVARQLTAVASELSGISARFQSRQEHLKSA